MKNTIDELAYRRELKKIMRYGIHKSLATDILETSVNISNGKNIDFYINYAITLIYGKNLSKTN